MTNSCKWIQGDYNIAREACEYYQNIWTSKVQKMREDILLCIPNIINFYQNSMLESIPTLDELRTVVIKMNPHSALGPDSIGGKFYQACFDIIKEDLIIVVHSFLIVMICLNIWLLCV